MSSKDSIVVVLVHQHQQAKVISANSHVFHMVAMLDTVIVSCGLHTAHAEQTVGPLYLTFYYTVTACQMRHVQNWHQL
jgi:hypothetical protein